MAQIVAGFGVPHTPVFPFFVKRDGPECEIAKLFAAQAAELAASRPDVIVMFDTDHLNTFFLDNLPIFALGVAETFTGPNDEPREVPIYTIPSAPDLAGHIRPLSCETSRGRGKLAGHQARCALPSDNSFHECGRGNTGAGPGPGLGQQLRWARPGVLH